MAYAGTWSGYLGAIDSNVVDIVAADIWASRERAAHFHLSPPYTIDGIDALVPIAMQQDLADVAWYAPLLMIVNMFDLRLWSLIGISLVALYLLHRAALRLNVRVRFDLRRCRPRQRSALRQMRGL